MSSLRLQFLSGSRRGAEYVATRARVRIGRSHDNDLVLPDEGAPRTGRHHAEAVLEDGAWWLVDLGSTHGTSVNGSRITRHRLQPGDRLALGEAELVVQSAGGVPRRRTLPVVAAVALAVLALAGAGAYLLGRAGSDDFAAASRRAARSTYLITVPENGVPRALATAFVISEDGLLATAAHVVRELERREVIGRGAAIVRAEPDRDERPIVSARAHARWTQGSVGYDLGILRVAPGPALVPLPLADAARIAKIERGVRLGTLGFPAATTDAAAPRARLATDVVGDVRDGRYLSIDLNIAPGTSGSPIFLASGEVVAVVAGGDFVPTPDGDGYVAAGTGVNWGVTTTLLREWLREQP